MRNRSSARSGNTVRRPGLWETIREHLQGWGEPLPQAPPGATRRRQRQGGLRSKAHLEPLPSPRVKKGLSNFVCPPLKGRASPYTINAATMRPCRGVPPAVAHSLAAERRSHHTCPPRAFVRTFALIRIPNRKACQITGSQLVHARKKPLTAGVLSRVWVRST
jgi:hypothetical protein